MRMAEEGGGGEWRRGGREGRNARNCEISGCAGADENGIERTRENMFRDEKTLADADGMATPALPPSSPSGLNSRNTSVPNQI